MRNRILCALLLTFIFFVACGNTQKETQIPEIEGYKLVWSDEFNTDGPFNRDNWKAQEGFIRNEELQWYQADNAWCEDGLLIIEARRERKPNPNYQPGTDNWRTRREYAAYTSASLETRGLHSWQFGRFEIRARIDTRDGLWPAFWTLGVDGHWPHCGEVDIMEYYRGMLLANVAWGGEERGEAVWDDYRLPLEDLDDPDWSDKFHTWYMEWDADSIKLYMDDRLMNAVSLDSTVNRDGTGINPLLQPHFIVVNLAIGGISGGDPSNTEFPSRYEIDYVRIYQKEE